MEHRLKAIKLRRQGLTYAEIMVRLGERIPKSTLSNWCRDIKLSRKHATRITKMNKENLDRAREKAIRVNKEKRQKLLDGINNRNSYLVENLSRDSLKIALSTLYLGEGYKWKSHRGLSLGNSSSDIIRLYINLLNLCYDINPKSLSARIQCRADQDIQELENYWVKTTGIPKGKFYKTYIDRRTTGKATKQKDYKGVCTIMGGGTEIQLELEIISKLIIGAVSSVG